MNVTSNDEIVLDHYRSQAAEHKLEPSSTMADLTTRELEIDAIVACVTSARRFGGSARLLEVGCGNGLLLSKLRERFPSIGLTGLDYSPDMLALAAGRELDDCDLRQGDVRTLPFPSAAFDVIVSERCLINILDEEGQREGLEELHRVLRPGGYLVFIEAFTDGLDNLNQAREELGLTPNRVPHHNRWFDKERFLEWLPGRFEVVSSTEPELGVPSRNFLSSHYFISRVLYPAVTRNPVLYNSEFVRFFRFLPPHGDYSPIQLFFLRAIGDS